MDHWSLMTPRFRMVRVPRQAPVSRRAAAGPTVHFEGTPTALSTLVSVPGSQRREITVNVALSGMDSARPVRALTAPVGETHTQVRLVLAASTPPGTYDGTVHTSDRDIPAVVLVRESIRLRLTPSILRITASPGGEADQRLVVFNAGNTPCRIGRVYAFGLFESEGLDRAIGAGLLAYVSGLERLATMADSLADDHGGLVRVTTRQGSGVLNPEESRQLVVGLRFSDRLKPGSQYFATWQLYNLRTAIRVDVVKPTVTTKEPQ